MLNQFRRGTDKIIFIFLADFHAVVSNKAVASFHKLKGRFTFTDAALARNEHANSVYID
ncbi:Uncharacterised protein [Mycobacteroides abscessus subsp. abscessus]|nr:Uncharacterised protein [Mycobacteroides abscessus subsp. abscessus]